MKELAINKVLRDAAYELVRELTSPVKDHNLITVRTVQLDVRIKEWDKLHESINQL